MLSGVVFHQSIHRYMPEEAAGPDVSLLLWPADAVVVPIRMCFAVEGSVFGGRITLAQRPFADMTATYILVAGGLSAGWYMWKRKRRENA